MGGYPEPLHYIHPDNSLSGGSCHLHVKLLPTSPGGLFWLKNRRLSPSTSLYKYNFTPTEKIGADIQNGVLLEITMSAPALRNPSFATQPVDFSAMREKRSGAIYGSDIDFVFEFSRKVFVFGELKYQNAKLPTGQRLALEHLVDALDKPEIGQHAAAIVLSHDTEYPNAIDLGKTTVTKAYFRYPINDKIPAWHTPTRAIGLKPIIIALVKRARYTIEFFE